MVGVILVSDYDGTLHRGAVSPQDLASVARFRAAGHQFGIATGRALGFLLEDLDLHHLEVDFAIGANGGLVKIGDEIERFSLISNDELVRLGLELQAFPVTWMMPCHGYTYGDRLELDNFTPEALAAHIQALPQPMGLVVVKNMGELGTAPVYEWLKENHPGLGYHFNHFNNGVIDITQTGVTKESAIHRLLVEERGVDPDQIHVIGDSLNDLGMLKTFHGYAITKGHPGILNQGLPTFDTVSDCIDHLLSLP